LFSAKSLTIDESISSRLNSKRQPKIYKTCELMEEQTKCWTDGWTHGRTNKSSERWNKHCIYIHNKCILQCQWYKSVYIKLYPYMCICASLVCMYSGF